MKIFLWILSILVLPGYFILPTAVYGQTSQDVIADSLRKELRSETGGEKIATQLELALHIFENENQEAKELAKTALGSAQEAGDRKLEMRSYFVLGRVFMAFDELELSQAYYDSALFISDLIGDIEYKGEILFRKGVNYYKNSDQVQALQTYSEALAACREVDDFKMQGSIYSMMGTLFRVNGMYDRAIEYNIKSRLNYKKANFEEGNAWVNYLLGRIYADLKSPQKALEYFKESIEIYEHIASQDGNNNGVAICLEQIAMQELLLGNHQEARSSIDKVMNIHTEGQSIYGISSAYIIYGKIEYSAGNFLLAENYFSKSLDLKKQIGDVLGFSVIYEYLGLCLVAKGQVNEGLKLIQQGLQQAELNQQRKIELDIHKRLSAIYLSINEPGQASFYQNEVIEIQNELLFGAASIKMEQLQAFYEIDEKTNQILELEKENEINSLRIQQQRTYQIFMVIGIFLAAIIALTIYLFSRKIQRNNQELNELNRTKDKLFSIISHDLKGPMGTTQGLSEVLLQKLETKNDSDFKEIFLSMHNNINETYDLLTNLLQWASAQIKGIKYSPETLALNDFAHKALKSIANQAEEKNIRMTVDMDKNIKVRADRYMLDAILRNLISNAIKFTNEDGNIVVQAIQKSRAIQVCIKDDGIGMSSDRLNKLFSLDTNTSTNGTKGERGTGLGLIVCKEFLDMHKGKIWVESVPDKGSSFCFTLPAMD